MTNFIRTTLAAAVAGTVAFAFSPRPVSAQQATDARWRAWTGCWQPEASRAPLTTTSAVCVLPAKGNSAVDILVVSGKSVTSRSHIEADGVAHPVSRDGCTGTERANWSASGTRVYLHESMTCDGPISRNGTGVMSFDPRYEWLDVRGVSTGTNAGVAVARYEPVLDTAGLPAEVLPAFAARGPAANNAILAASAPLTLADIADVSTMTDSGVTATWLVERNREVKIDLDARQLTALADQGVPPSVIDVLVALSHPTVFALNAGSNDVEVREQPRQGDTNAMRDRYGYGSRYGSPYGAYGMMYDPWWGWDGLYSNYGPYGMYGYGYGLGYSPYYSPFYGYYPGSQPIIVVTRPPDGSTPGAQPHGRVVKGRGYTSGSSSSSSARTSGSSGSSSTSGSSTSSSSGSSSSGSSSSGSSGRTAVRKPPL